MPIDKIQKYVFWTTKFVAEHIKMYLNFMLHNFFYLNAYLRERKYIHCPRIF